MPEKGRRELKGNQSNNPLVNLTDNIGGKFTGVLQGAAREVKTKLGGTKYVYNFTVLDSDMDFVQKEGTEYVSVDVNEGEPVTIMATGPLHSKLLGAEIGQTIEIEYLGKEKTKKGNEFHNFSVFVVE